MNPPRKPVPAIPPDCRGLGSPESGCSLPPMLRQALLGQPVPLGSAESVQGEAQAPQHLAGAYRARIGLSACCSSPRTRGLNGGLPGPGQSRPTPGSPEISKMVLFKDSLLPPGCRRNCCNPGAKPRQQTSPSWAAR